MFAATRKQERGAVFARQGWTPVVCDITDPQSVDLPEVDVIVFAVGFDRGSGRTVSQVYVNGLSNVLEKHDPFAAASFT